MEERGYQVVRPLGQGGQGRVYEVRNRQGQLCVLKQLPWVGEAIREQGLGEVRLLSSLRHPCIVPYLDSFLARSMPSIPYEDVLCLVMSRCEHDLRHACVTQRALGSRFSEPHVTSWFTQLCWGLQHLHARKFLHRDIKSQNVLLTQGGFVQLADFGVAGHLEHSHDLRHSIVGTPSCMSPEMLEGRPYGLKTDIWALGCVLYEMMALEAPFQNCESYAAIIGAVLHAGPLRAPEGYSQELAATVETLLARKPDKRPSCADLLGGRLLCEEFRSLLQRSASGALEHPQYRKSATFSLRMQPSDASAGAAEDEVSYHSDFESYSGSEPEEATGGGEARGDLASARSNSSSWAWRQLHVEAEALLQPGHGPVPAAEAKNIREVLCQTLGSHA
eukprot:CAMPEP_0115256140 /NCGR_PEP_ID=MMETSP0270-20121206/46089_1 /TAXON_ID=71861 /ORGANISM="Scrippsiella trochoidea, Strain CCMP3099" /LENGTH=389 /DNA_ID=CAMNT_0002671777 /DNA_START=51 /DNA_END=1217 /DNA_ORIENTATION=-